MNFHRAFSLRACSVNSYAIHTRCLPSLRQTSTSEMIWPFLLQIMFTEIKPNHNKFKEKCQVLPASCNFSTVLLDNLGELFHSNETKTDFLSVFHTVKVWKYFSLRKRLTSFKWTQIIFLNIKDLTLFFFFFPNRWIFDWFRALSQHQILAQINVHFTINLSKFEMSL